MDKPKLIGDIYANWKAHADGKLTVIFACGVEHAEHIAQEFLNNGISAASIHGGMCIQERESIIRDWRRGIIKVVANCMILVEGFDFPELECCILARPTKSISLYLQAVERIMRPASSKLGAIILDHAGCIEEHGAPHIHREWTLLGEKERKKKNEAHTLETCKCCDMVYDPEPRAWLADVQEKILTDYIPNVKNILKSKVAKAYSSCPGCGLGVCKVCNEPFKLSMAKENIDDIAFIKQGFCPSCHALYDDATAHFEEGSETNIPETTADMLTLYSSDDLPMAVKVRNRFREHMRIAREKGYKEDQFFTRLFKNLGMKLKSISHDIQKDWWRMQA
jgi:superfamily II DNA or RNA helicase